MLNKMTVTELAEVSGFSKSFISQVKHGKRPPSERLLQILDELTSSSGESRTRQEGQRAIELFLKSRREGISQSSLDFYSKYLTKAIPVISLSPTPRKISSYLDGLSCSVGGKHAYFRAISVFFNWLYSPKSGFPFQQKDNPIKLIDPPKKPKLILPTLTKEQVNLLISKVKCVRDAAIISLFTESGLRLSELMNIKPEDIDWDNRIIRIMGKGNKEGYAAFGALSEKYLKEWLAEYQPGSGELIWNIGFWGIKAMLHSLGIETGLQCNPHTFRRTFACLLRKAGVDTMTIKDLGRWESLEMVQRYTRSVTFHDSLKLYKAPLS